MTERNKNGYIIGKKFEVVKATTKPGNSVTLGDKKFKFGKNGAFYLNDAGVADELEHEFGHRKGNGDVVISPVNFAEPGHKNVWSMPDLPFHIHPSDDPDWYEYAPGKWKPLPKKRAKRGREPEELDSVQKVNAGRKHGEEEELDS